VSRRRTGDPPPDPFGERRRPAFTWAAPLLGARVRFESDSAELMQIVRDAFAGLPARRPRRSTELTVRLVLGRAQRGQPTPLLPVSCPGMVGGVTAGSGLTAVVPRLRRALVVVPRPLLRSPYHARYELIEFAVYLLAARCRGQVALHAACVAGSSGGALLLGNSGAGKSTLTLAAAAAGLRLLAEDSVLVDPRALEATGIATFLHLGRRTLRLIRPAALARRLSRAPTIRRRSGAVKLEIDARAAGLPLARAPLALAAVVFVSARPAGAGPLLHRLEAGQAAMRLEAGQRYAARQPGWGRFLRAVSRLPAFELRRAAPALQVEALRAALGSRRP